MIVRSGRVRRFEIVFRPDSDDAPIPLESVFDANQATMAFHAQVQRLMREGTPGELVIMNHYGNQGSLEGSAVLRLPLPLDTLLLPHALDPFSTG
jgi:hypothetical protein